MTTFETCTDTCDRTDGALHVHEYASPDDDSGRVIVLPTRWVICDVCDGDGQHAHRIDGHGITASEWGEWGDEEREMYLRGDYDAACEGCHGTGKVREIDHARLAPEVRAAVEAYERAVAECDAAERAERRYMSHCEDY